MNWFFDLLGSPASCRAKTLAGEKCRKWDDVDMLGYCSVHTPLGLQCRGTVAAETRPRRCNIRWDLDHNFLCEYHEAQAIQCHHGLLTGSRCLSTDDVNLHGFCAHHLRRDEDVLREFAFMKMKMHGFHRLSDAAQTDLEQEVMDIVTTNVFGDEDDDQLVDNEPTAAEKVLRAFARGELGVSEMEAEALAMF